LKNPFFPQNPYENPYVYEFFFKFRIYTEKSVGVGTLEIVMKVCGGFVCGDAARADFHASFISYFQCVYDAYHYDLNT